MASAHAGSPRPRGAGGLARRPRRGLSACRPDGRRPPRGLLRITGSENETPGWGAGVFGGVGDRAGGIAIDRPRTSKQRRYATVHLPARDVQKLPHPVSQPVVGPEPRLGLRNMAGGRLRLNAPRRGLFRPVTRRRGVRARTGSLAPCSRHPTPQCVFSRAERAARPSPRRPPALAPHGRRQGGGP
jgi:hypothetical protein